MSNLNKYQAAIAGRGKPAAPAAVVAAGTKPIAGQPRTAAPQKGSAALNDGGSDARSDWRSTPAIARARAAAEGVTVQPIKKFASRNEEEVFDESGEFAPRTYGGTRFVDGRDRVVAGKDRAFDKKGELNAYDVKDALVQIKNVLDRAKGGSVRLAKKAEPGENRQARLRELQAAARDERGLRVMGQEILQPIKYILDYEAWGRKFFLQKTFEQGEFFRLTKDVRATAFLIGQNGQGVESRLGGAYVDFDEYMIASYPVVGINDIYRMGYDVLDRAQDTARQEIGLEEDKRAVAVMDAAATVGGPMSNPIIGFTTLGIGAFEDTRVQIEKWRLQCDKFAINRLDMSDVIKTMSTQVDPVTERELILAGYIGSVLNCAIIVSAGTYDEEVVPQGTFYAATAPEYLGVFGIRFELFSEPFNQFALNRPVKGFAFMENVGHCIPEPWKVCKATK